MHQRITDCSRSMNSAHASTRPIHTSNSPPPTLYSPARVPPRLAGEKGAAARARNSSCVAHSCGSSPASLCAASSTAPSMRPFVSRRKSSSEPAA